MTNDTLDPEVVADDREANDDRLALRRPDVPITLSELAARKGEAPEIIEARVQVLETLHRASIRMTDPTDWILFKSPDDQGGQIVGYLQDAGCDRVRDLWGIEVFNISKPEKVAGADPETFHYLVTGDGRCKLTRQVVEQMEGGRSSTDDFCRGKTGAELHLLVRKAARANLDGNIVRELAGLKSVAIEAIRAAWVGTPKQVENCRLGRGFGTRDERLGARSEKAPDLEPPTCPHCGAKGVYRPSRGNRGAFYGCPNFNKHPQQRWIVDAAEWQQQSSRKPAAAPAPEPAGKGAANGAAKPAAAAPLSDTDIPFGGSPREPGEEG
jgi:hypothetical protein